ncbi:MAG: hypothetical protein ABI980_01470 [Nitrospirota bacterium]
MQHHTEPDGVLIVTSTSRFFDWLLLFGATLCTVPTVRGALHGSFDLNESAPLIGTAFFLLGFLVTYERTRFEFDPGLGLVRWSHIRIFATQHGVLPFIRVKSVILQTALGSDAVSPSCRVTLVTDQGELPLTNAYSGGMQVECEAIAARIRTLLRLSSSSSDIVMDSIHAALSQGRKIEAIKLVRLHKGFNLTEATRFVEQLPHTPRPILSSHS